MSRTAIDAMLPYVETHYGSPLQPVPAQGGRPPSLTERPGGRGRLSGLHTPGSHLYLRRQRGRQSGFDLHTPRIPVSARWVHIISTAFEHHAILHTLKKLERKAFEVELLPVGPIGTVTAQQVDAIRPDTCLVTAMYANNEIGSILPIAEIGCLP